MQQQGFLLQRPSQGSLLQGPPAGKQMTQGPVSRGSGSKYCCGSCVNAWSKRPDLRDCWKVVQKLTRMWGKSPHSVGAAGLPPRAREDLDLDCGLEAVCRPLPANEPQPLQLNQAGAAKSG